MRGAGHCSPASLHPPLAAARNLDCEEAFVAGLLQGFGATTVLAALEDIGVTDEETALPLVERLQVQFGCEIAERWNVPLPVRLVIEHCMDATPYDGPNREVVRVVAASLAAIAALDLRARRWSDVVPRHRKSHDARGRPDQRRRSPRSPSS